MNPKLASTSEWGDSDSNGYTNRAPGRRDATFTAEGKYDYGLQTFSLFMPGDRVKSVLWINPALVSPQPVVPAAYWDFPFSLCSEFNMTVNMDSQEVIGWTSSWGADGIFYAPGQTANRDYQGQPAAPAEALPVTGGSIG